MYRLLHVPDRHTVLIHPVPDCHPGGKRVVVGHYLGAPVWGLKRYDLCRDSDFAERRAHAILQNQNEHEKWLYCNFGKAPESRKEDWEPDSDAAVGRRLLDRNTQ